MASQPRVSIIIPCKEVDDNVMECIIHCRQLDYENYDIILLSDDAQETIEGVKIIPTGPVTPGAKRNIGIRSSNSEIYAFIDSDAYPRKDWLSNGIKYFDDPQIAAIGGPGLTPVEDGFWQKASGYVLSSIMVGSLSSRYKANRSLESDDIHSCNFIVRKGVLAEVGGWNEKYWPGEDTLICLAIKRLGRKLIEVPNLIVYHHRKPLFKDHLKQVSRFGLHRGFFAKKFKGNSLKPTYFIPSLFIVFLLSTSLMPFVSSFSYFFILILTLYLILSLLATILEVKESNLLFPVWLGILSTHIVYGVAFLVGLLRGNLER